MQFTSWTGLALVLLSAIGCNNTPADPITTNTSAASYQSAPSDPAPQPVVQADIANWQAVQEWVASQQGKVVVVDVWSTSCLPCVKEFPHFVALHDELAGEIACASVNIDYYGADDEKPEDIQSRVLKFLTSKGATMQNFVSSDADEEVHKQIATAAIPAVLVYDRDGKLHTTFNNDKKAYGPEGFNYVKDITPLVKQLLQPNRS